MCSPSAPSPPDPQETAAAQTGTNVATAIANTVLQSADQQTPYGSLSYNFGNTNVPQIEQFNTPGTPSSGPQYNSETGMLERQGTGGTPGSTGYRVGGKEFDSYEQAQSYQQGLPGYDANSTYSWTDPSTGQTYNIPRVSIEQTLSPEGQRLQDAKVGAEINLAELARDQSGRIGDLLSNPMDMSDLPRGAHNGKHFVERLNRERDGLMLNAGDAGEITRTYGTDFSQDRQRVEEALMSRLNPSLARDKESLRTSLINQGVTEGSEAFDRAMNRTNEQATDARFQAILAGGQEQSRLADLEARRAGFENAAQAQAFGQMATTNQFNASLLDRKEGSFDKVQQRRDAQRKNALQEKYAARNQPINEIASLLGTGQVQQPNFMNFQAGQIPTTDFASITANNYAQEMAGYQAQQGMMGGLFQGLGQLGAAGIGAWPLTASDERLKDDKKKIGETNDGIGIYSFKYKGSPKTEIGLMAQDVRKKKPGAVQKMASGFLGVDYKKATS